MRASDCFRSRCLGEELAAVAAGILFPRGVMPRSQRVHFYKRRRKMAFTGAFERLPEGILGRNIQCIRRT